MTDIKPSPEPSLLAGVNVLLEGPGGTGKTYSIGTLVDSGVEVFCFFTETSGLEALLGYWTDRSLPVPPNLHWNMLKKPPGSFGAMAKMADTINRTSMDALFKMQDPNRHLHNQWVEMLRLFADFQDQRTGQSFGDVGVWGPDKALVIDNLSGLNPIAFSLVIGAKLLKDQRDWGAAMDLIEKLFRLATDGCSCHVILISHVEREVDLVQGGVKITVATLGVKLAPKLVPMFSDVILSVREGSVFTWTTANSQADLKARNLPIANNIQPNFKQIIDKWTSRGGRLSPTVKS
jgi:hypothetical protein